MCCSSPLCRICVLRFWRVPFRMPTVDLLTSFSLAGRIRRKTWRLFTPLVWSITGHWWSSLFFSLSSTRAFSSLGSFASFCSPHSAWFDWFESFSSADSAGFACFISFYFGASAGFETGFSDDGNGGCSSNLGRGSSVGSKSFEVCGRFLVDGAEGVTAVLALRGGFRLAVGGGLWDSILLFPSSPLVLLSFNYNLLWSLEWREWISFGLWWFNLLNKLQSENMSLASFVMNVPKKGVVRSGNGTLVEQ